ncbi:MAG: 50S ribosomal protein L31, partial [Anaerolineae bacterium]|nr:50S ribosomal protein L31 [Anaerolineae bacterium]
MKANIHPKWFAEANVVCACGNTWKTGATIPEIRTDICSACHPFYTGEQRIVDTEGQVDRFMKKLQQRSNIAAGRQAREEAKNAPTNPTMTDLGLDKRTVNLLKAVGIETAND